MTRNARGRPDRERQAIRCRAAEIRETGQRAGRPAHTRDAMVQYVRDTLALEGIAPSYGMICAKLNTTREHVSRMVQAAEREGQLRRVGAGKVRRIRLAF